MNKKHEYPIFFHVLLPYVGTWVLILIHVLILIAVVVLFASIIERMNNYL